MPERSPSPAPGVPRDRPRGTIRIGTIAGADVLVSTSWFFIAAIIAVLVAPRIEQVAPGLGAWKFLAGAAFAVILYLSVLLHEASHAWMARRYGHGVSSITLHFLGGMTAMKGEARNAKEEFWIAFVGPITSIAIGLAALAALVVTPDGLVQVGLEGLAGANLLIGAMNLIPGLPLDGGRVLKAGVWAATGDIHRGIRVAGWGGRLLAVLALGWPLYLRVIFSVEPTFVDYLLAVVLAIFLWGGATASIQQSALRRRIPVLQGRGLARRTVAVAADLPLSEAVRAAQDSKAGSIVTLGPDGRPAGLVNEAALLGVPAERRPWMPTSAVATTLEGGLMLPADIGGEELIRAISLRPAQEYLLLEVDGTIHGVLSTADVDRAFRAHAH